MAIAPGDGCFIHPLLRTRDNSQLVLQVETSDNPLNLAGHRPVVLTFDQGGHGWKDLDEIDKAYRGIAGFLRQHLDTGVPAATAANAQ